MKKLITLAGIVLGLAFSYNKLQGSTNEINRELSLERKVDSRRLIDVGRLKILNYRLSQTPQCDQECLGKIRERKLSRQLFEEIDEALADREEEIEKLAEKHSNFSCDASSKEYLHSLMHATSIGVNNALYGHWPYTSTSDTPIRILENALDDIYNGKHIIRWLAYGRGYELAYERCLGEEGRGLFDMYLDHNKARRNGDCENAPSLARAIGGVSAQLGTIKSCVPVNLGDYGTYLLERNRMFYETIERLETDEDLRLSLRFIDSSRDCKPWLNACVGSRTNRGINFHEAYSSCRDYAIAHKPTSYASTFPIDKCAQEDLN